MYKICIDTGGTFTESVVLDSQGKFYEFKTPTTPRDFSEGVLNTIKEAANYFQISVEEFLKRTEWIVHGTTVSTNALVQRKLARTALITSKGFRDIIEMRRSLKIETKSMYDALIPPYEPLIPRYLRFTVDEKTKASGEIISPVNENELQKILEKLKDERIEAIAICFINSYANPANEIRAAEICKQSLNGVFVSYSSDILPKLGEYERESTCVINASVGPIVNRYLTTLETRLRDSGYGNQLLIVQANQFVQSISAIVEKPVYLTGSGPAAGPAGAVKLGDIINENSFLIGDMGGTTWDASLVNNGEVSLKTGEWIEEDRLGIKIVDVTSIGAGGGSIGWMDSLGLLRVGPQSASSDPGPACYNQGGTEPTVTDAAVILGYINPDNYCGGKIRLRKELAETAMQKISRPLDMSNVEAAQALFTTVNSHMADAISEISTRKGYDIRDFNLLSTGGGGPLCGAFVADILGIKKTVVPRFSSSFCAWSMFFLDIGRDYLRSYLTNVNEAKPETMNQLYENMLEEALRDLSVFYVSKTDLVIEKSVEVRYEGQYHILELKLPDTPVTEKEIQSMISEFHKLHEELFTFSLPWVSVELINLRLIVKIKVSEIPVTEIGRGNTDPSPALLRTSQCYFNDKFVDTPIYDGLKLKGGNIIRGSAIIEEPTTTTVIPVDHDCLVDTYGNYIITKNV
jgi:N-methylhydantoinase A